MKLHILIFIYLFAVTATPIFAQPASSDPPSADSTTAVSTILRDVNPVKTKFTDLTEVINSFLPTLLTIAGLILFAMIIWGGFQILTAGTNEKAAEAGKTRITQAVVGFIVIFSAYWIAQIVEIIIGVNILGTTP